jgi:uncharacterized membrane protein SpoIIM required for sporulation
MAELPTSRSTASWFEQRTPSWRSLEDELPALEDRQTVPPAQALDTIRQYPELARDVAVARRLAPGSAVTRKLQGIYARVHRAIFRAPWSWRESIGRVLSRDAATVAFRLRWHIASVTVGFALAGWAGWWLVATYPELVGLFASETMVEKVQGGELWTDDLLNIMPSSLLSVSIFTNNIVVALSAVSLGALYGLGTIYIVTLNGLMLGGVFAFTAQHGMAGRLFEFICAHGFVELSVIFVAGAIGFFIGEAIARPGHRSRVASFRRAVAGTGPLLLVCVIFLVGAGLIEGYISPDARFSLAMRLVIGLGYWCLFLLVLTGFPAGVRSAAAPSAGGSG